MSDVTPATTNRPPISRTTMVVIGLVVLFLVVWAAIKLTQGPSTRDEVCASFDTLGDRIGSANGFFDNAVFSQAGDLSDLAGRYKGQPDLTGDAKALSQIADSNSTNTLQLTSATRGIARMCGHPLDVF